MAGCVTSPILAGPRPSLAKIWSSLAGCNPSHQLNPWLGGDNRLGRLKPWDWAGRPSGLAATLALLPEWLSSAIPSEYVPKEPILPKIGNLFCRARQHVLGVALRGIVFCAQAWS